MEKKYIVYVRGCVEPEILGPYDSEEERSQKATPLIRDERESVVFDLNIDQDGNPFVSSYPGSVEWENEATDP